jgi:hypothetical protein
MLNDLSDEILSVVGRCADIANSDVFLREVKTIFVDKTIVFSKRDRIALIRPLVAKLALNLPIILRNMNLPESILALYPDAFGRVANNLINIPDNRFNLSTDFPYINFVLGLSIPCGAQQVDLISKVKISSVIQTVLRFRKLHAAIRYFQAKGYGPWLRIHTDTSYLTDFNEKGWDDCYMRIAELLKRRKDTRGMVGTSWFYDPQMQDISPHLVYLRQLPLERGAFLLRHRTGAKDIEFAIQKSKRRRLLYQEQKYMPKVYSIVWPRKELIYWAEETRRIKIG